MGLQNLYAPFFKVAAVVNEIVVKVLIIIIIACDNFKEIYK